MTGGVKELHIVVRYLDAGDELDEPFRDALQAVIASAAEARGLDGAVLMGLPETYYPDAICPTHPDYNGTDRPANHCVVCYRAFKGKAQGA